MLYSLDGLEAGVASLSGDDGSLLTIPAEQLPPGLAIGDLVQRAADGTLTPDPEATRRRREHALELFRKLRHGTACD